VSDTKRGKCQEVTVFRIIAVGLLLSGCQTTIQTGQKNPSETTPHSPFFDGDLDFSISAEYEYNSVVSIAEVAEITGGEDSLLNLRGAIDYEQDIGKNTEFSVGYTYRQKTHEPLSLFDRQNHYLSAGIDHAFVKTEIGIQ